jgi:tRNA threonylcarbamoyladenosine biosynthesis protein TsaE
MDDKRIVMTHTTEETQRFAEEFGRMVSGGTVVCLYGDLGYGKTTFTQGLAKGLGIEGRIISPTFIIMRSYKVKERKVKSENDERAMLYHVDLYRVNHEQEFVDLGLLDMMQDAANIVVIEWPDKLGKLLPEKRIDIHFDYVDEESRRLTITSYTTR